MGDRTSLTLGEGMKGMSENVFINIKNRSRHHHRRRRDPEGRRQRRRPRPGRARRRLQPLLQGRPADVPLQLARHAAVHGRRDGAPCRAGKATVRFEFAYDGGGIGKGGLGTIYVNDKKVAEGRIERTQPMMFSADETADVGVDDAMPVTEDYKLGDNAFTGKIHKVTIEVGRDRDGHEGRGGQGRRRSRGKAGRGHELRRPSAADVTSRRAVRSDARRLVVRERATHTSPRRATAAQGRDCPGERLWLASG